MAVSSSELLSVAWECLARAKSENGTFADFLRYFDDLTNEVGSIVLPPMAAARYVGCTDQTLRNKAKAGVLHPTTEDGVYGYRLNELMRLKK